MRALCAPPCAELGMPARQASVKVRDLWSRAPLPDVMGTFVAPRLAPHGSSFVLLTRAGN